MQVTLKDRESVSAAATYYTTPVDISGHPAVCMILIMHAISGTSPDMTITLETSANLEDWADTSVSASATTASYQMATASVPSEGLSRYVRCKIVLTGTNPYFNYSLFLNLFQST